MDLGINYNGNKGFRLLSIYERLNKGEILEKAQLARYFGVTQKTIQRDIDDLRVYLTGTYFSEIETTIKYDKAKNGYYLVRFEREWLTNEEVLALCKILLESRAFCREELDSLISKLLIQVAPNDRKKVGNMIRSEQHHYVPLRHGKYLFSILWELSQLITKSEMAKFTYTRQDGILKKRVVKPVSIMFSEYYFYLIAYMVDRSMDFPTIFRIDRITELNGTKQFFNIPYKNKFNDGEFRKRVQFMYSGELKKITFNFSGASIEAVLDRLPTAEVIAEKNGVYTIKAEVYGNGIDMWIRSQGNNIELLQENLTRF
ncbi:helix-turn-helix transcriptional regulator [Lysinibacillus antri]|uniref:WYL domain-containing transcriptional regulator n=1 Tax=Lysinibacillus antri TaxID=2498145 RepID=A0A432LBB5_9BACI|nr:WYL domain-containing protein [Lysinibacillus antri]RUL51925.1 WYL domain-containing transcriptional regulator [Lysinibacillus antri]